MALIGLSKSCYSLSAFIFFVVLKLGRDRVAADLYFELYLQSLDYLPEDMSTL